MPSELFQNGLLILDGAMGTVLQQRGLPPGGRPELLGLADPALLEAVHREYIAAGSRVIYANTFGANGLKLAGTGHSAAEAVAAAVAAAKRAAEGTGALVALDIGPLGALLEPMGDVSFDRAYELFREMARAGAEAGADLAVIETMTDLYEAKAALLAVKENTDLPVLVTMSFEGSGRTFTGCTVAAMARTLEGLGADAVGLNCSLGPEQVVPLLGELAEHTRLPVVAKPNAGLPDPTDGHYDLTPEAFAAALRQCVDSGAAILGGCCGTSPEYIRALTAAVAGAQPVPRSYAGGRFACTPRRSLTPEDGLTVGTLAAEGEESLRSALLEGDLDYVADAAIEQDEDEADLLEVRLDLPGVDEAALLPQVVREIQSVTALPLRLTSADPAALEAGLRAYNGKPVVGLVSGSPVLLAAVLPIAKKYGAAVMPLTEGDGGPLLQAAAAHGIPREDVWVD